MMILFTEDQSLTGEGRCFSQRAIGAVQTWANAPIAPRSDRRGRA